MEHRNTFDFFLGESSWHEEPSIDSFYLEKGDDFFIGKELLINDIKLTYYIYIIGENRGMLMLYLGDNVFDYLVEKLDKYNYETVVKTWPILMNDLKRGADDNYTNTALIKFISENFSFWTACTIIENIDFTDLETKYVVGKLIDLYSHTIDMLQEYHNNDVSNWNTAKGIGRAVYDGYRKGRRTRDILQAAIILCGAIFGFPEVGEYLEE